MKKRPDKENLREDWFGGRIVNGISKGGKGFLRNPLKSVTDTLRGGLRLGFDQAFGILGDLLKSMGAGTSSDCLRLVNHLIMRNLNSAYRTMI